MNIIDFLRPVPLQGMVRIGSTHDGGYVVYDRLLIQTDTLLSYGVGWDTAFEEHFHQITGKSAIMFDPTMFGGKSILDMHLLLGLVVRLKFIQALFRLAKICRWWWKKRQFLSRNIYFIPEGIAVRKKDRFDTLQNHIIRYGLAEQHILLKIDIEGDEYAIFEESHILGALTNVHQIIIEWHDLSNRLPRLQHILSRLNNDFVIVHIHGNNYADAFKVRDSSAREMQVFLLPDVLEMTLVRRTSVHPADILNKKITYPITGLDYPNDPRKPDISLAFIH